MNRQNKNIESIYPLSHTQEGMLFHTLSAPESGLYFEQFICQLHGSINRNAFKQAWQQVMERHSVLRTLFVWEKGRKPFQLVRKKFQLPWAEQDWQHLSPTERDEHLKSFLTADREQGFVLDQAPLMRCAIIQMAEESYYFIWSHHHILMDGWCLPIVFQEVLDYYQAFCQGQTLHLEPVRPYRDYIAWIQLQDISQAQDFWHKQLKGFTAPTPFRVDKRAESAQSSPDDYEEQTLSLSKTTLDALQSLGRQHNLTLNTWVQGAWALLLSHYSGDQDIVFGATVSGRPAALVGVEFMVGLFINTLPVRVSVSAATRLLPWLQQLQSQLVECEQYSFTPLVDIQKSSDVSPGIPLFESIVVFENYPIDSTMLEKPIGDIKIDQVTVVERTNYPLTVVVETGSEILLRFSYEKDRFEADTVSLMMGHLKILLEGMVTHHEQVLSQLPLLSESEHHQLLVTWNNTQINYPLDRCLHQLIEAQVERTPEAVAVAFEDQQLSYRELNQKANQLARYLQTLGVKPEVLVGICIERSIEMVIGLLGILKAGGAYVPLDPDYPEARLAFMLEDAGVPILLTQSQLIEKLPSTTAQLVCLDEETFFSSIQNLEENPNTGVKPSNLAYMIYTSGSTGKPKGAMNSHLGICNRLLWMQDAYSLTETDRVLQKTPFSFDVSVWEFFWPLLVGARLVVAQPGGHQDSAYLVQTIGEHQITTLHFVPSMLQVFVQEQGLSNCSSLKRVICSGEALPFELQQRFFARLTGVELHNLYGPTEAAVDVTYWACQPQTSLMNKVPIGRPIANIQIYLLDDSLNPTPIGVPGELHIGGLGLARGYFNRPELTADKFIPNPFSHDQTARLYKTGDLARYLPDGQIEYLNRLDNQVKIRGFRIELGEIEAVLAQYPTVQENTVIVHEELSHHQRLVAYLVPETEQQIDQVALRAFLKERLPEYMVPSALVVIEAMPLTPNGKIDRRALTQLSVNSVQLSEKTFVAPRTSEEALLADIWAAVLGIERVGIHDNFFELGGDSILSIQVVSRATQAGLQLKPRQLFQYQTVAELAGIANINQTTTTEAEQGLVTGTVPLTPIQHWFLEQTFPERHHFNQSVLLEVSPRLTPAYLGPIVAHLLRHHDALRLRFSDKHEQWITEDCTLTVTEPPLLITAKELSEFSANEPNGSFIHEPVQIMTVLNLSELSNNEQRTAIEWVAAELQASLNLSDGPMLRVALFMVGNNQPNRLLIIIHHLAVDGVSWRILLEDIVTAYQQLSRDETITLPAKTTSFKHWAVRLQEYAVSDTQTAELDYWMADARLSVEPLPVDYRLKAEANTLASQAQVLVSLTVEQTQALLSEVHKAYHTQINDLLLTALVQSLAKWTAHTLFLVDIEGHGREDLFEEVDLSRTVGWFTSLFPVLLEIGSNSDSEAIKSIKEQLREIPQRGVGYGLQRYLNPKAIPRLQALPEAQISFNYLGQFHQAFSAEPLMGSAPESSGLVQSKEGYRRYLLEINGLILRDGRLQVEWNYSENIHQRATIERLATEFIQKLQTLIIHCQSPEAMGYTPSDFPLASLESATLDRIIGKRQINDLYPLSPLQQGMLFHTLYAPSSGVYVEQLNLSLDGNFNISAFQPAWQTVIERYSVFRTAFVWEGLEQPLQMVYPTVEMPWVQWDWRDLTVAQQQERLADFITKDQESGFQLDQAPLMRATLIQMADERHQFIWSFHHLLIDGWCLPIIFKEILEFYHAFCQGQTLPTSQPRPYRDYIAWLQQQDISQAKQFWQKQLTGFTAPTPFRVDNRAEIAPSSVEHYEEQTLSLSQTTNKALQSFARQHHLTLNTLVQGAWAVLLSRYSGEERVVFGATVSGRSGTLVGIETMVGLFLNTLPVSVLASSEATLLPWLLQLQAQQAESEPYSFTPLVDIQGWSDIPHGIPLFESIVVFENYPIDSSLKEQIGSLKIGTVHSFEKTNYPLTLVVAPSEEEFLLKILYNRHRFDTNTVRRMMGHLETLLEGMVATSESTLAYLPLLTEAERHQLLVQWNDTSTTYLHDQCVHQMFEAQVEQTPNAVAVVIEEQQLTYSELNSKANQLAHHLQTLGVKPEVLVGICIERSALMVIGLLGILKAGGAYLPLDSDYPAARLALMLEDAGVPVLLTIQELVKVLPKHQSFQLVCLDSDWEMISRLGDSNLVSGVNPSNLAYVIYTSGSTGKPKGVCVPHKAVVRLVHQTNYACLDSQQTFLQYASISFDAATLELWGPLLNGAKLVVMPPQKRSLSELSAVLKEQGVTILWLTSSLFNLMLDEQPEGLLGIKQLLVGGEELSVSHIQRGLKLLPGTQFINGYGPTENTTFTCCYPIIQTDNQVSIPIGKPITYTTVYILDEYHQPQPIGLAGELYTGGVGLARGYLNRAELTTEKFVSNPFSDDPSARLYKTGDLARYLPDGNIEYLGRIDNQVKIRGFRIELGEIEAVLAQHPAVQENAVLVHEESSSDRRLFAYIVFQDEQTIDNTELRDFLQDRLPDYMIPNAWLPIEAMPLNPNGKIDRHALAQLSVTSIIKPEQEFVAPRTPMEEMLADIWADILKVEKIGINDNFFELGGHSLLVTQVISRIRDTFSIEVPLHYLFELPTVAGLAERIETIHWAKQSINNTDTNHDEIEEGIL